MAMSSDPPPEPPGASGAAFDAVADRYDDEATDQPISRWVRGLVWARLEALFPPGSRVLELGCGTGEDACWLAARGVHVTATDASPAMLEVTARKAADAGLSAWITTRLLDLRSASAWALVPGAFDGAFSNYGPLNCIGEWHTLGTALAGAIRTGGRLGLAVMGPFCAWETAWHALHLDLRTAARRWRGQATARIGGVAFPVYYPTPARVCRDLGPSFRMRTLTGLGVFLPPSDLYAALGKRPRLARTLLRLEQRLAARWPFRHFGDHFWIELERVGPSADQ
jgi:SAM-dependent methyltransferase